MNQLLKLLPQKKVANKNENALSNVSSYQVFRKSLTDVGMTTMMQVSIILTVLV